MKIDRFIVGRDTEVTLDKGPLIVERSKGAEPKFEVKTPYALLAARGTEFFAGPSKVSLAFSSSRASSRSKHATGPFA